jgi:large conductance mechanosensitive channel
MGAFGMLKEFKAFLLKHNVVGLAVAVVIGGAVGKLVTALVGDIIMPIVGVVTPEGNWREAVISIGKVKFAVGNFAGAFVDFIIISAVVFLIVKNLLKEETEKK